MTLKNRKNSQALTSLKRSLRLEVLEARQMLSVNPQLHVTTASDIVDSTDEYVSLREAIASAESGDTITFADELQGGYVWLEEGISTSEEDVTIEGNVEINAYVAEDELFVVENFTFDGVQIALYGGGTAIISDCLFTGEYSDADYVLMNEVDTMILYETLFSNIDASLETELEEEAIQAFGGRFGSLADDQDNEFDYSGFSFAMIVNTSNMYVDHVFITENTLYTTTDRIDNNTSLTGIFSSPYSDLAINGLLIANNEVVATSTRGDINVTFTGIDNFGVLNGYNVMMYGNDAVAQSLGLQWFDDIVTEANAYGICTSVYDAWLTNATILETLKSYRADFYMLNSIYWGEGHRLERGFIISGDGDGNDGNNLVVTDPELLKEIFPAYDAEENTFNDYDFRMWIDSEIVDAGNNDNLHPDIAFDVVGNNRINNDVVEIGAVESDAVKLTIDGPVATPDGTSRAILTWNETENATGYRLRYFTGTAEESSIADDDWVEVVGDSLDDLMHVLEDLDPRTWVAFQVMALGDNLSYIDSDWSEMASCWTKAPLKAPDLVTALPDALSIDLSWVVVPNAQSYVIEYCEMPEDINKEDLENSESRDAILAGIAEDTWEVVNGNFTPELIYTMNVSEDTGNSLDYNTMYCFRIKAIGTGEYVDSEYAYGAQETGGKLVAPELGIGERTSSSIDVTWNDTVNMMSQVKDYLLQYRKKVQPGTIENEWTNAGTAPTGTTTFTVENLDPTTMYEFRIMAHGMKKENQPERMAEDSEWSAPVEATTKTKLDTPDVEVESNISTGLTVTWEDVDNESGYNIVVKNEAGEVVDEKDVDANVDTCDFTNLTPGTSYIVEVVARGDGEFMDSEPGIATGQTLSGLTPPTLTLDDRTTNSIRVKWNAIQDCSGYEIQFKYLEEGTWTEWQPLQQSGLTGTFLEDGTIIEDIPEVRDVKFQIRALGVEGVSENSAWSTPVFASCTLSQLDIEAADLTAEGSGTSTISAEWGPVENAAGYILEYRLKGPATTENQNPWSTENVDIEGTSAIISGLTPDTEYELRLTALGDDDNYVDSEPSAPVDATTWLQLVPPTLYDELTVTTDSISGTLNLVDYAAYYVVEYSLDGGETWSDDNVTDEITNEDPTFEITDLTPGANVLLRMKSIGTAPNAGVDGKISVTSDYGQEQISATVQTQLAAPVIEYMDLTTNSVKLSWNTIQNAEFYHLVVKDVTDSNLEVVVFDDDVTDTNRTIEISPNHTYIAFVQAMSSNPLYADSDLSNEVTFTSPKGLLANIVLEGSFNGNTEAIDLSWNDVSGATGYKLEYRIKNTGDWNSEDLDADTTTFSLDDCDAMTTYEFQVTALADADNTNSISNIVEVMTPAKVNLSAVVLKEPSADDATTIPDSVAWVDEWTNVYVEVWADNGAGLVSGRTFQFGTEFAEMYNIDATETPEGITLEQIDGTTWEITVEEDYVSGNGADMLARIALKVNTESGVAWEEQVNEEAFKFDNNIADNNPAITLVTDVYAVPGDMDDDGVIAMKQDHEDSNAFIEECKSIKSWADFNHDGIVDIYDRQWMINNNNGKSWNGEDAIVYPTGCVTPFMESPVFAQEATIAPAMLPQQDMPEEILYDLSMYEGKAMNIELPLSTREANPIPVSIEANGMSGGQVIDNSQLPIEKEGDNGSSKKNLLDKFFASIGDDFDFLA